MIQKILLLVLAFSANFILQWYANFSGKLPTKGSYLGLSYDSVIVRALVTQFEYLWVLIIINTLFTLFFNVGFESFKNNFFTLAIIWLSMGPITAIVFNSFVLKERMSGIALLGVLLVVAGSILVIAHKEVALFFKK